MNLLIYELENLNLYNVNKNQIKSNPNQVIQCLSFPCIIMQKSPLYTALFFPYLKLVLNEEHCILQSNTTVHSYQVHQLFLAPWESFKHPIISSCCLSTHIPFIVFPLALNLTHSVTKFTNFSSSILSTKANPCNTMVWLAMTSITISPSILPLSFLLVVLPQCWDFSETVLLGL